MNMKFVSEYESVLNRVAQGFDSIEFGLEFMSNANDEQMFWQTLSMMVKQAHPTRDEALQAIRDSGLRSTFTPCVLLVKGDFPEKNLGKICSLPEYEHEKAFRLLIEVFRIADKRRREEQCADGCSHWWHQDTLDRE